MSEVVNVGDRIQVVGTFKTTLGVLTNPTTVTVKVITPDRIQTNYTAPDVVNLSTGVYALELDILVKGKYLFKFQGTGAVTAATEDVEIDAYTRFV